MTGPNRRWPDLPNGHPFTTATLPYGVFAQDARTRVGVRLGDQVLDLAPLAEACGAPAAWATLWASDRLNAFLGAGSATWQAARAWLIEQLDPARPDQVLPHLIDLAEVDLRLPVDVADYVDFYASAHHARNVGRIFRPDSPDLPPNWKHLPIGYHGRSGTVVVSGTAVHRPRGQRRPDPTRPPLFGPSTKLDIEAELGFVVGGETQLGSSVSVEEAPEHLFGAVLLNDWSARDLQAWEYVPLGPFLGKSFATSISAWVVPMAALEAARVPLQQNDPEPLPYLVGSIQPSTIDVHLHVRLNGQVVAEPEYRDMYWAPEQMLAHQSVNGASLRTGDLFGSGTISGPHPHQRGSLLELTWDGSEPLLLRDGTERGYLRDGDVVRIDAWAPGVGGSRIGFGEVAGTILASAPTPQ